MSGGASPSGERDRGAGGEPLALRELEREARGAREDVGEGRPLRGEGPGAPSRDGQRAGTMQRDNAAWHGSRGSGAVGSGGGDSLSLTIGAAYAVQQSVIRGPCLCNNSYICLNPIKTKQNSFSFLISQDPRCCFFSPIPVTASSV